MGWGESGPQEGLLHGLGLKDAHQVAANHSGKAKRGEGTCSGCAVAP